MRRNNRTDDGGRCREIAGVFLSVKSVSDMSKFLGEIFTRRELRDIGLRWELMRMLHRGLTQRRIAADLGISLCKITRGARILKDPRSVTGRMIGMQGSRGPIADGPSLARSCPYPS